MKCYAAKLWLNEYKVMERVNGSQVSIKELGGINGHSFSLCRRSTWASMFAVCLLGASTARETW